MYVAHYKSTNSSNEFYSQKRETLDFPTQVVHNKKRYLLTNTYIVATPSQLKNVQTRAKELKIPYDIAV